MLSALAYGTEHHNPLLAPDPCPPGKGMGQDVDVWQNKIMAEIFDKLYDHRQWQKKINNKTMKEWECKADN